MKLQNLTACITGASQGLGKCLADRFLQEGADIAICSRNRDELSAVQRELSLKYPRRKIFAEVCDVAVEQDVDHFIKSVLASFGSVNVLVLNAGIYGPMGPTESVSLTEWRAALEINLFGALLPCRALIPQFKTLGAGKIIFISGGGATSPLPNISAYAASKAASVRLMETLAEELKPFHVDVNAIAPGALATRMVDQVLAAGAEQVGEVFFQKNKVWKQNGATPLSLGAALAVYLASSESNGITGRLISAQWDPWPRLAEVRGDLLASDIYTLRRIVPEDRGQIWEYLK